MTSDQDSRNTLNCYNCNEIVNLGNRFCPYCGQANHPTKLTIGILIKDFVDNFFNLDSKFFKTLFHIYSPTYLTKEYVAGRRIKYANPIRLFVISIVIFFGLLVIYLNGVIDFGQMERVTGELSKETTKSEMLEAYDKYLDTTELNEFQNELTDSLRNHLFKGTTYADSSYLNLSNFISFDNNKEYKFLKKDILEMDPDSILVKYNITEFKEKVFIKQTLKVYKNGSESIRYLIGNLLWVVVLTIILSAVMLKILFIRHKIFYIEHIILLCNIHSFFFILMILAIGVAIWVPQASTLVLTILSTYFVYIFFVFKKYYQQGFFKTLFKFLMYVLTYVFILNVCAIFVLIVSFILF